MVFMAMTATSFKARRNKFLVGVSKVVLREAFAMAVAATGLVRRAPHCPIHRAASVEATTEVAQWLLQPNNRLHSPD